MRESYFSFKVFALRFCNIYKTTIFKKKQPTHISILQIFLPLSDKMLFLPNN